jgi:hypothetical protein
MYTFSQICHFFLIDFCIFFLASSLVAIFFFLFLTYTIFHDLTLSLFADPIFSCILLFKLGWPLYFAKQNQYLKFLFINITILTLVEENLHTLLFYIDSIFYYIFLVTKTITFETLLNTNIVNSHLKVTHE